MVIVRKRLTWLNSNSVLILTESKVIQSFHSTNGASVLYVVAFVPPVRRVIFPQSSSGLHYMTSARCREGSGAFRSNCSQTPTHSLIMYDNGFLLILSHFHVRPGYAACLQPWKYQRCAGAPSALGAPGTEITPCRLLKLFQKASLFLWEKGRPSLKHMRCRGQTSIYQHVAKTKFYPVFLSDQ